MKFLFPAVLFSLLAAACANNSKKENPLLEKYPGCFHANQKIVNKCIEKNEAGDKTTAMELENTAYPGQYK